MYRIRTVILSLALALFFIVGYTACIQEDCANLTCSNGGVCVQNVCTCPLLYEGNRCEEQWHSKFSKTWSAEDAFARDTTNARRRYEIAIYGGADSFIIHGLADTLGSIICKRSSRFAFSFKPDQRMADTFLTIRSGRGTMDENGVNVRGLYSFTYKDTTITTYFTWTR